MLALLREQLEQRSAAYLQPSAENCAASASRCGEVRLVAMLQREHKNGGSSVPSWRATQLAQFLHKKAQKRWLFALSG